jgi:hypothetical protein
MFAYATAFNQPIGDWDVSNGLDFVSNERPKRRTQTFTRLDLF